MSDQRRRFGLTLSTRIGNRKRLRRRFALRWNGERLVRVMNRFVPIC
jgi:hypothetical protein